MEQTIISLLITYESPAIFLGSFFFGESIIISSAFLAGQGLWSITNVYLLAFIGTISSDMIWFALGRAPRRFMRQTAQRQKMIETIDRMTGNRPFWALLFIKFLYGTRVLFIMFLSLKHIGFKTFLAFDAAGTLIWLAVMTAIGYAAGAGIADLSKTAEQTKYVLTALAVVIGAYKLTSLWMEKRITKE